MKLPGIVLIACLSFPLLAQTAVPPTLGNGSSEDPYQIETLENLFWLS